MVMINDLLFEDLGIQIIKQWTDDLFNCADTLQNVKNNNGVIEVKRLCCTTGRYFNPSTHGTLENYIQGVCFNRAELPTIADILNCLSMSPYNIVDRIWKECNRRYNDWDKLYHSDYEELIKLLGHEYDIRFGWGSKL